MPGPMRDFVIYLMEYGVIFTNIASMCLFGFVTYTFTIDRPGDLDLLT